MTTGVSPRLRARFSRKRWRESSIRAARWMIGSVSVSVVRPLADTLRDLAIPRVFHDCLGEVSLARECGVSAPERTPGIWENRTSLHVFRCGNPRPRCGGRIELAISRKGDANGCTPRG